MRAAFAASRLLLALTTIAAVPATAQEPVRGSAPVREPPRTPRVRPAPAPEASFDFQVFPLRRARMGITVNVEPRPTDSIGALVTAVSPGGPADRAGLRSGDLVVRLSGRSVVVARPREGANVSPGIRLIELAARLEPNDTVALEYRRGAERRTASLVTSPEPDYRVMVARLDSMRGLQETLRVEVIERALAERQVELSRVAERQAARARPQTWAPKERYESGTMAWVRLAGPLAGLEFATMNPSLAEYFGTSKGVLVTRAHAHAPLGLRGGDVILSVDGRAPSGPAHLARILMSYDRGERITLDVLRSRKRIALAGILEPPTATIPVPR